MNKMDTIKNVGLHLVSDTKKHSLNVVLGYMSIIVLILFTACKGKEEKKESLQDILTSKDVEKIRKKKTELDNKLQDLKLEMEAVDVLLNTLNKDKNIPLVTSLTITEEEFVHYVELQGDVKTKQNILIYPEVSGLLQRVYVKEGQYVKKGQVLASIDDGGLKQQLVQLKVRVELAKVLYEKQQALWDKNIGSEVQYLQAKTEYTAQKSSVVQLEEQLAKFDIRAPFSGVIDDIIKEEGVVVAPGPGAEIFRIVNLHNMYVASSVPETYLSSVTVGKKAIVSFPILGTTVNSSVRQVGNFIDPTNRTFKVEIPVPAGTKNVKPNLNSRIKINDYTNDKAILIPLSIISENAEGEQYVYVLLEKQTQNNKALAKAVQKIITVGKTEGDKIEVLEGIALGDELIQEGARSVKDGQKVIISTTKN